MIKQPYQAEIETVIMHTLSVLGNVRIRRYLRDNSGRVTGVQSELDVPIRYGYKTQTLAENIQVNGHYSYPSMSLVLDSISRDNDRNRQKDARYHIRSISPEGGYPTIHMPVPITMGMTLDIVSVFEEDILQILTNFMAYFNPYVSISWKEPFSGQELITRVKWDGSSSYVSKTPLQSGDKQVYKSSVPLTVESFIFREELPDGPPIICFDLDWYGLSASSQFTDPPSGSIVGEQLFCAYPCVRGIYPTCISPEMTLTVFGSNMDHLDAIFLLGPSSVLPELSSASSIDWCKDPYPVPDDHYYDLYQFNEILSADNPPFYGLSITDFQINDEYSVSFPIPANAGVGFVDVRLASLQAGYTDITLAEHQAACELGWIDNGLFIASPQVLSSIELSGYGFSLGFSLGFNS